MQTETAGRLPTEEVKQSLLLGNYSITDSLLHAAAISID